MQPSNNNSLGSGAQLYTNTRVLTNKLITGLNSRKVTLIQQGPKNSKDLTLVDNTLNLLKFLQPSLRRDQNAPPTWADRMVVFITGCIHNAEVTLVEEEGAVCDEFIKTFRDEVVDMISNYETKTLWFNQKDEHASLVGDCFVEDNDQTVSNMIRANLPNLTQIKNNNFAPKDGKKFMKDAPALLANDCRTIKMVANMMLLIHDLELCEMTHENIDLTKLLLKEGGSKKYLAPLTLLCVRQFKADSPLSILPKDVVKLINKEIRKELVTNLDDEVKALTRQKVKKAEDAPPQ